MKKTTVAAAFLIAAASLLPAVSECSGVRKIITFNYDMTPAERRLAVERLGGRIVREYENLNSVAALFSERNAADLTKAAAPGLATVETDAYRKWLNAAPSSFARIPIPSMKEIMAAAKARGEDVPLPAEGPKPTDDRTEFGRWLGWFLDNEVPWGINRINAPKIWKKNQGGGVRVGVIDTGIDSAHPDLAGRISGGFNAITPENPAEDDNGHGTHVAGTIAANLDSKGVAGAAPKAALYAVKVLDNSGSGYDSDIIAGIDWCIRNRIQVINMSLGTGENIPSLRDAVKQAHKAGMTVVCAAGNDGGPVNYPAAYPQAIAVSASSIFDIKATYTSSGPEIDFIAPGSYITSTYKDGGYTMLFGTSMACPHVSGLAALAIAAGAKGPAEVLRILTRAAVPIPGYSSEAQGAGMIDAAKISCTR